MSARPCTLSHLRSLSRQSATVAQRYPRLSRLYSTRKSEQGDISTPSKPPDPTPATSYHPLKPSVPTDDLGLPVTPVFPEITHVPTVTISRERLHKLHTLSALNPPAEGSEEERALLKDLGELVGLMDYAKTVDLPEGDLREVTRDLLSEGVGQVVLGEEQAYLRTRKAVEESGEVEGRQLLQWATRRVGDYYASKVK